MGERFLQHPLQVELLTPTGDVQNLYVFVGNLPPAVRKATVAGRSGPLAGYFGREWKRRVGLVTPKERPVRGGDELEDLLVESLEDVLPEGPDRATTKQVASKAGGPIYSTVYLDPRERLWQFRARLAYATGVPWYRQLLYYDGYPYQLRYEDGSPYRVDVSHIFGKTHLRRWRNLPIDSSLKNMTVVSYEDALLLEDIHRSTLALEGRPVLRLLDLATVLAPVKAELVRDPEIAESIRQGFVGIFWPWFTQKPEAFRSYLAQNTGRLDPRMSISAPQLRREREFLDRVIGKQKPTLAILFAVARIATGLRVNPQLWFRQLAATPRFPFLELRQPDHPEMRRIWRGIGSRLRTPPQLRSVGDVAQPALIIGWFSAGKSTYIHLGTNPQHLYLQSTYLEEQRTNFPTALRHFARVLSDLETYLRRLHVTGVVPTPTPQTLHYVDLRIAALWQQALGAAQVRQLQLELQEAESAGYLRPREDERREFQILRGRTARFNTVGDLGYLPWLDADVAVQASRMRVWPLMRVQTRTADVRVHLSNLTDTQLVDALHLLNLILSGVLATKSGPPRIDRSARLKRLEELDPDLYMIRRTGAPVVYSRLCQEPRQPLLIQPEEVKTLSDAERRRLVAYWNFTQQRKAFYMCPNRAYPVLGFRTGVHPAGYCLPCCRQRAPRPDSAGEKQYETCLETHRGTADPPSEARHTLGWGKTLDANRRGDLPAIVREVIQDVPTFLIGGALPVDPTISGAARALKMEPSRLAKELARVAVQDFDWLGVSRWFSSSKELADIIVLVSRFATDELRKTVQAKPVCLQQGPLAIWCLLEMSLRENLVAELLLRAYDLDVVFIRPPGAGAVPPAQLQLSYAREEGDFIILARSTGTPTTSVYQAGRLVDDQMQLVFGSSDPENRLRQSRELQFGPMFLKKLPPAWTITHQYVDSRGLAYGLLVRYKQHVAYAPVEAGPPLRDIPYAKKLFKSQSGPGWVAALLLRELQRLGLPQPSAVWGNKGRVVSLDVELPSRTLRFRFRATEFRVFRSVVRAALSVEPPPYDFEALDEILSRGERGLSSLELPKLGAEAAADLWLYRRLLLQVRASYASEKNATIRTQLRKIFRELRWGNLLQTQTALGELLEDYPGDLSQISLRLARGDAAEEILKETFTFDRVSYFRVRDLPLKKRRAEAAALVRTLTVEGTPGVSEALATVCNGESGCRRSKLVIRKTSAASLTEALAHDLGNPLRAYEFLDTSLTEITDPFYLKLNTGEILESG